MKEQKNNKKRAIALALLFLLLTASAAIGMALRPEQAPTAEPVKEELSVSVEPTEMKETLVPLAAAPLTEPVVLEEIQLTKTDQKAPEAVRTVKAQPAVISKAEVTAPVEEVEVLEEELSLAQLPVADQELLEALEVLQGVQEKANEADYAASDADDAVNRRQEAKAAAEAARNDAKVYEAIKVLEKGTLDGVIDKDGKKYFKSGNHLNSNGVNDAPKMNEYLENSNVLDEGDAYTYRIYCNKDGDYNIFVTLQSIVANSKGDQVEQVVKYNTVTGAFEMGYTTVDQQTLRDLSTNQYVTVNILSGVGYPKEADVTETANAALEAFAAAAEEETKASEELTAAQEVDEAAKAEAEEKQAAAEEALDDAAQAAQTAQEAVDTAREEAQEANEEVSDAQEALETAEQDLADANEVLEAL